MAIKEIRESKGMTQAQFARFLGVTQGAVSSWESGRWNPTLTTMKKISALCGCTVDEILAEPEEVITLGTLAELETSLQAKLDRGEITVEEAEQEWQDYRNRYEYMRGW